MSGCQYMMPSGVSQTQLKQCCHSLAHCLYFILCSSQRGWISLVYDWHMYDWYDDRITETFPHCCYNKTYLIINPVSSVVIRYWVSPCWWWCTKANRSSWQYNSIQLDNSANYSFKNNRGGNKSDSLNKNCRLLYHIPLYCQLLFMRVSI